MQEILGDLEKNRPLYIVDDQNYNPNILSLDDRFKRYPRSMFHLPELDAYVQSHYMQYTVEGQYIVYRRNST
jgi:hypothetical protein